MSAVSGSVAKCQPLETSGAVRQVIDSKLEIAMGADER